MHVTLLGRTPAPKIYSNGKEVSAGKKHYRIELAPEDSGISMRIALNSKKIFDNPPKPTLLERIFGRKYIVLNIQTDSGAGFVKVNAESFRKRIGLTKIEFQKALSDYQNRDLTSFTQNIISEKASIYNTKLGDIKNIILDRFDSYTDISNLDSAKILFRFTIDDQFKHTYPSKQKDFTIFATEDSPFSRDYLSEKLEQALNEVKQEKLNTDPYTHALVIVVYKDKNGTFGSFSKDSYVSKLDTTKINSHYMDFAGKKILDDQLNWK